MKMKFVSFMLALAMTAGFSAGTMITASAADAVESSIGVAETLVDSVATITYDKDSSTELTRVLYVDVKNVGELTSALFRIGCDVSNVASISVTSDLMTMGATTVRQPSKLTTGDLSANMSLSFGTVDATQSTRLAKFVVTLKEDKAMDFKVVGITLKQNSDFKADMTSVGSKATADATAILDKTAISVAKFVADGPDPISTTGSKVVRHTDGLDTPAEYWVAELNPAGVAFNTIKVVATDSKGATAEGTQTIATLTGDSAISVHVAILNAANEVSKVDVTASYVE